MRSPNGCGDRRIRRYQLWRPQCCIAGGLTSGTVLPLPFTHQVRQDGRARDVRSFAGVRP
jgi:hypothetical protein